jgi:integrase
MARRATGQVVERRTKRGPVYALRFYAAGERRYETLGSDAEGWNRRRAEDELAAVMAAVRAGTWRPRTVQAAPDNPDPTFHEYASEWYSKHEHGWRPNTRADYLWALSGHLLPYFRDHRLSEITVEEVDRYAAAKQREGKLSNNSINSTLTRLSQILEEAAEYGKIARNPARGKRRRLKGEPRSRPWIEPEQLMPLLRGAEPQSRPVFATLAGTGMRPSEACGLEWRDVNLATGTITVREAKTNAGVRVVDLPVGLIEVLSELRARAGAVDGLVFVTRRGSPQNKDNLARRLKGAIKRANAELARREITPLPESVSPYSFRRTYSSLRAARWIDAEGNVQPGDDPVYIAEQMGHTDPGLTFRVYQRAVKRRERLDGEHLASFDEALEWARMGTSADSAAPTERRKPAFQSQI